MPTLVIATDVDSASDGATVGPMGVVDVNCPAAVAAAAVAALLAGVVVVEEDELATGDDLAKGVPTVTVGAAVVAVLVVASSDVVKEELTGPDVVFEALLDAVVDIGELRPEHRRGCKL